MGKKLSTGALQPRRQRGAVLIVGLVMLTVMTLLVVSMIKTSVVDLKIGGVTQDAMVNFDNAEVGMMSYFANNNGKFSNNCINLGLCVNFAHPALTGSNAINMTSNQVYCGDKPGFTGNQVGLAFQTVVIDLVVETTTTLGAATRLHAGVQQDLPPGACTSV
jgi:hypothetical protein